MADFRLEMSFQGIDPHANSVFDERMKSINMAIYASNGSGKSFNSKSFKRVTDLNSLTCLSLNPRCPFLRLTALFVISILLTVSCPMFL